MGILVTADARARPDAPQRDIAQIGWAMTTILESVSVGICIYNADLVLMSANQRAADIFGLPAPLTEVGVPKTEILRFRAERGDFGRGDPRLIVRQRLSRLRTTPRRLTGWEFVADGLMAEVYRVIVPGGGVVVTAIPLGGAKESAKL